jgi:uncharacterized protein (DUF433 family)
VPVQNLLSRITVNPEVLVGKPIIRGLRISVDQILKALAGGVTVQELLAEYPDLEKEDIQAALLYAADLVNEERVFAVS